jgi:hypothetical protein
MAKYKANVKIWLSHECRYAEEGEEFDTVFPTIQGKPMKLEPNIELVDGKKGKQDADVLVG